MLSGLLNSEVAIEANISIMRAFVYVRQIVTGIQPINDRVSEIERQMWHLKQYIETVFTDYNDINEDTRMQLELINESLAELQAKKKKIDEPLTPIGFTAPQYRAKDKD